jgi:hypothetical protein
MGNFIIKEQYYAELESFHQNHEKIKMYFDDTFELNKKYLQSANIFKGQIPDLKEPKESIMGSLLGGKSNDSDHTEYDYENSIILYESMKLNRVQACDERLWAYLCHGLYYKYVKKRYKPNRKGKIFNVNNFYDYNEEDQTTVKNYLETRFFTGSDNRTFRRNGVALLWWAAELTHSPWDRWNGIENKSKDKFYYTKCIFDNLDLFQGLLERTIGKEPKIVFTALDIIIENKLTRSGQRDLLKKINSDVYIYNYSSLSQKLIRDKMDILINLN